MRMEELKTALAENGFDAKEVTLVKNGVTCTGFQIITENGNIAPVVYYSPQESMESFLRRVREALDHDLMKMDVMRFTDPDYVRAHAYVSVQKRSDEQIVKRTLLNLELILRVSIDLGNNNESGTVKVDEKFLRMANVTEDELWDAAIRNTEGSFTIRSMAEVMGLSEDEFPAPFDIVTNEYNGAAALFFPAVFKKYCEDHGMDECIILPSSIQELLIVKEPIAEMGYPELAFTVRDVNETTTDPILQLDPAVYRYSLDTDTIELAYLLQ